MGNLAEYVKQGLEKINACDRHVAVVPIGNRPQIRHEFLADRGYFKKQSTTQVKDPVKTSQQKQHDQITSQAEKFFGTGDVEIKND